MGTRLKEREKIFPKNDEGVPPTVPNGFKIRRMTLRSIMKVADPASAGRMNGNHAGGCFKMLSPRPGVLIHTQYVTNSAAASNAVARISRKAPRNKAKAAHPAVITSTMAPRLICETAVVSASMGFQETGAIDCCRSK